MAKSISYNPNDANSIMCALLEYLSPQNNADRKSITFSKNSKKGKPVQECYQKIIDSLDMDKVSEKDREKVIEYRRNVNPMFLKSTVTPPILNYISFNKWNQEESKAVRAYVIDACDDLNDASTRNKLTGLITLNNFNELSVVILDGLELLEDKIDKAKYLSALKKIDRLEQSVRKLTQEAKNKDNTIAGLRKQTGESTSNLNSLKAVHQDLKKKHERVSGQVEGLKRSYALAKKRGDELQEKLDLYMSRVKSGNIEGTLDEEE